MKASDSHAVSDTNTIKSGSALLVTLLVVSLLLVMVLSLVAVVRMELRKVVAHQELMQARANAQLGLQMAIAKLQVAAGPDTRVTAPLLTDESNRPNTLHIGQAIDSAPFIRNGGGLELNEAYGQARGYFISHDPNEAFNPNNYWPYLGGTELLDGHTLLVGPGSVRSDVITNPYGVPDGYVAAPLRDIESIQGNVTGQYAYHIRDNGLQAQINLTDPFRIESEGRLDFREQAITAQRVASELLLPNFDPDNVDHQDVLGRVILNSQLDLTTFVGNETAKDFFHGITLQSLGLPVNVQSGGFRRDLTPVMREMEDNLRNNTNNEDQLQALFDFQQTRMQRWRDQTLALEGASQPGSMLPHRWNALNAISLRQDQNRPNTHHSSNNNRLFSNPHLREKVFPPNSDMSIQHDPGGANWRQLLSHATKRQSLMDNSGTFLQVNMPSERSSQVNPVLARLSYNFYLTLDWPILRIHHVPVVVLWNPYNVPIGPAEGEAWHFVKKFETDHMRGLIYRFLMQHDDWNGGNPVWTPTNDTHIFFNAISGSYNWWHFRLLRAPDDPNIVIPPGQAIIFSLNGHEPVPSNSVGTQSGFHRIDLIQGLFDDGGYSFYLERNIEEHFKERAQFRIDQGRPHYFSGLPLYRSADDEPIRHIAINETGFSNWNIENSVMLVNIGHNNRFRDRGLHLLSRDANWVGNTSDLRQNTNAVLNITHLYMRTPQVLSLANVDSLDDPDKPNLLNFFGGPPPSFDDMPSVGGQTRPFIEGLDPAFPSWGMAWGLRMPLTRLSEQVTRDGSDIEVQGSNFTAPSRWLVDYNPTSPFILGDPNSVAAAQNYRYGGYVQPASYIGGFSIDDRQFRYHEMNPPETDNMYIGLGDSPFWETGSNPSLVLYEIPRGLPDPDEQNAAIIRGSEEIASLAAFMHARPHSLGHAFKESGLLSWWAFGTTTNNYPASDHLPNSPTYAIGNSFASKFVPGHKATHSVFSGPTASAPSGSPPYFQTGIPVTTSNLSEGGPDPDTTMYIPMYDTSYLYNKVLWDDFILTPSSNRRMIWRDGDRNRDFNDSASQVKISGAFNVNSTSVTAWAAMLSAMLDVELSSQDGSDEASPDQERIPMSRFLDPVSAALSPNAGQDLTHRHAYSGYRRLTQDEIFELAQQIVEQVKRRGPFLSLSEFVNRMLIESNQDQRRRMGPLQAAINDAGLNDAMGVPGDEIWLTESDFQGSWGGTTGNTAFHGLYTENVVGSRAAASPGYLLQSDILNRIGAVLQPRSDTFTIRAFGSLGSDGNSGARTWIEATVQRVPDFVDTENTSDALPEELSELNRMFGRRFNIISFRWLNQEDI
ncbi:MAG: hypothetical protein JJU05_13390 [Verrucomicrobia bacterium]|nr:hypothetical protein [Verrucomicrobiota bacterium]MCH8527974.1 hypothetical protein [Kiritimatiellia bacterium]